MRAAFDLHGVTLEKDESLNPSDDEQRWPAAAALRYLFLGAMGYLHDGAEEAGTIRIEADGANALRLVALPREADASEAVLDAHRAPRALAIDAVALQNLAEDLGYAVALDATSVRLVLATRN